MTPKPLELGTWNFDTIFTTSHVSGVTYQVSHVIIIIFDKLVELVGGGSVITEGLPRLV